MVVSFPKTNYRPLLKESVITSGALSEAQLEDIVLAGGSHSQILNSGERRGFFLGGGTGYGKGRAVAAIIQDNINQGRKKAVWISKNANAHADSADYFEAIGGNPDGIFYHKDAKTPIAKKEGVLLMTYGTLKAGFKSSRDYSREPNFWNEQHDSRLQQIAQWLGKDFDGVIIFDESHQMANAIASQGGRGMKKASQTALAGVELQKMLPNARVVYASATGATEVSNLAYAQRLGLWGDGTPFANSQSFINAVESSGLAGMEIISKDLKAMGLYSAKNLSFDGVGYETLQHNLSPEQVELYNQCADAWQLVLRNIDTAIEQTGASSGAKAAAKSAFWGAHQRFFGQIIMTMQMPTVIQDIQKSLEEGKAIVLQLVNTNEAATKRALTEAEEDAQGEEVDFEELDLSPKASLIEYIRNGFPVNQFQTVVDENGNERQELVMIDGKPVQNPNAVRLRDNLIANLERELFLPEGPLDIIINTFGVDKVAEITGRTVRIVRKENPDGNLVKVEESRTTAHVAHDKDAFMDGKKDILVFSDAGGTGASFHSDLSRINQKQRKHYVLQAGWRADKAVQGFGRSHRSNQRIAPIFSLATTDLKAHRRYLSSVAKRLDQLGALTKGSRQAGGQGILDGSYNLEGSYATQALFEFYQAVEAGRVPGVDMSTLEDQMALKIYKDDKDGNRKYNEDVIFNTKQFLNRIMSLRVDLMDKVFDGFMERLEEKISNAKIAGTYDEGIEAVHAIHTKVIDEVPIYTDEKTGGQTFLTSIELELPNEKTKWSEILSRTDRYGDKFKGFWTEERSGKIYAIVETMEVQPDGFRDHKVRRISVVTDSFIEPSEFRGKYHKLPDEQAAKAKWNEDYEAYPATRKKTDHIVKGLILPIWNRLPEKINVRRYVDDNGAPHLGRWFSKKEAEKILETFEVANTKNYKVSDAVNAIRQDGYFKLANQFEFTKGKYQGLDVIKITGPRQYSDRDRLERAGAMFQVTSTMSMSGNFYVPIDTAEKVVDNIIQLYNSPIIAIEDAEGNNFNRVNEPQTPYNKSLPPSDFLKQSKTPSSETVSTTPLEDLISKAKENKSSNSDVSLLNEKKRTYKTKEGETLQYSLFSDSDSSVNDRSGTGLLQREESRVSNPSLRQLKEGEITSVEQKYTRDKNFVFDGRNKIESTDDIAYLFRQLENKSVENMFACFVKDGKPTIVHMSAGGQSSTVFNHQVLNDGISRFSPDIVYLIHNHPSGNLQYSDADIRMHQGAIDAFGDIIGEHILINLTSGLYATFRSGQSSHEVKIMPSDKNRAPEIKNSEKKYTVYSFDKQVFKENAVLPYKITGPDQVAEFISAQRFTDGNKLSALILARNNDIKAYIHLSDVDLSDPTAIEGLIKELQAYSGRFGGQGIILSGTRGLDYEAKRNLRSVKETLKKSDITLQDYVSNVVNRSQYESLANEGLMEPSVPYEAREVNDPGKSKPTHALDYLNGTVPYSRGIKSIKEATKYIPGVTEGKEVVEKFKEALNITSSPSGKLNKESGELAKRSLRENLGTMSRNLNMAAEQLKKASNRFDRLSKDECLDFYDKMETGQKQSTEGLQGYADALRTYYDKTRDNVRDLGTGKLEQFNENYMAHFYENEGRVSEKFYAKSKTPLEGPKGFLRQRTYDTLKDAMDHGLIPISYNPVVMAMMKIREMERYVMAHKTLNELKDTKYISYYKIGTKPPEGWTMIDDKVSRVMIPKEGGLIHVGNWYALDGAADIFNRFLSKGLRGNQLYNLWRGLGNLITQFQLGFSFFHLGFTSLDASISKLGMGAGLVYHGKPLEGLKHIALSPFAPITNIIQGDRLQKAWYGNPSTPEMQEIAKFMEIAGGRAKMDDMYREKWGQKIIDNWKKNRYISALGEIPLAIVEKSNWLVLEYIVPKQKMGVFVDMARREIMLHPNDTPEERRRRLQYNWNSVDNRMGQLAYDNLFWNKTLKDIAFGTIRSVGWNLGTIREVGGAPIEAGHIILDALHGKTTKDTNKVEYVLGMIGMGMLTGAIFMYLRTGKRPETMKDYFFPQDGGVDKNGDPTRVSMPSYLKDIYHYFNDFPHGLLNTAKNKLSPLFGIIVQIATNKDYFGTKIYNEDDPIFQQGKDLLWYLFGQFKPFGISNAQKNESKKFIDKALPFIGITPAPYDLNMTDTEKLMSDILREKLPIGGRTKEQAESSQSRYKLRNAYQADHNVAPLISAMISGEITSEQLNDITKNSGDSPLKRNAKKLTEVELAYVYRQSDLKVKKQLAEILREKVIRKLRTGLTKDERENFMQLLDQIRTEQNTTEPKEGSHQSSADQLLKYLNK
ncbi:MAG: strawberry notch family protein [Bacteroidetes bacterium]|nr:strawberry notch family protein [Bacteroidota bacterium]